MEYYIILDIIFEFKIFLLFVRLQTTFKRLTLQSRFFSKEYFSVLTVYADKSQYAAGC